MRYDLSELAAAEIEALETEGVRLTALDVCRINALAHRVEAPQSRLALSRGVPVAVGGVYLWPQTLAGAEWFRRIGGELAGIHLQTLALAYAMANGREDLPEDIKSAERVVNAWGKKLTCRHAEIVEAIKQVLEQDERVDTGETGRGASAGEISVMLSAMTHTPPNVWEYQCSITYALAMLDACIAQNAAEGNSTKFDPRIKAERALGLAVAQIRKRHFSGITANV